MNTTSKQGLITLNIALLAVLAAVSLVPTTDAYVSSNDTYVAVPGTLNGLQSGVVYIASTSNRAVLATTWDRNKKKIIIMAARSIERDAQGISKE
jgi:outer membrane protease